MRIAAAAVALAWLGPTAAAQELAAAMADGRSADGLYISWREHLIDDERTGGVPLRGSDGLVMADLDGDGFEDIVSVHESDDVYDGAPEGHIRIAFGTLDPHVWQLVTLAEGAEAGAAEDVAVADVDGDGDLDVVAACELEHLIYFENPGAGARSEPWPRLIPTIASGRGSYIRVFLADLDGDGRPEIVSPNKGAQDPTRAAQEPRPIGFFQIDGAPLTDSDWVEHVLTEVPWPINAQPADLDGDGDLDIVGGTVAEGRIMWFENSSRPGRFDFAEHPIEIVAADGGEAPTVNGFNMEFADIDGDGRLDIVTFDTVRLLGINAIWLAQPASPTDPWRAYRIGGYAPDTLVGLVLADIDGDSDLDLMTGGYSLGSRSDDVADVEGALGRLAWFEQPDDPTREWPRHDFSRRARGMFDKFVARDLDGDNDLDFVGTRGNSGAYDGVFWLEQVRTPMAVRRFERARDEDSPEVRLPD